MLKFHWDHLRKNFGTRKNLINPYYPRKNFNAHQFYFIHATHEPTAPTLLTSPLLFSRPESYNDHLCWNNFRWRNISKLCKIFFVIAFFKWPKVGTVIIAKEGSHAMITKALEKIKVYTSWTLYLTVNLMNSKEHYHTFGNMSRK